MSTPNANWQRWFKSSINKHFNDGKGTAHLYIEGAQRGTREQSEWAELRIDGPNFTELSRNCWEAYVEINVLISCQKGGLNLYGYDTLCGRFTSLFVTNLGIYKYGPEVQDDQSFFGCLSQIEKIQVSHFGVIDPATNLMQGTIEGHYKMVF